MNCGPECECSACEETRLLFRYLSDRKKAGASAMDLGIAFRTFIRVCAYGLTSEDYAAAREAMEAFEALDESGSMH